ncbi:hypothetical protein DNP08_23810, partial [Salmonella enterica subsp. enterica serovar Panama]
GKPPGAHASGMCAVSGGRYGGCWVGTSEGMPQMAGAIAGNNKSGVRNDMRLQDLRYGDGFLRVAGAAMTAP